MTKKLSSKVDTDAKKRVAEFLNVILPPLPAETHGGKPEAQVSPEDITLEKTDNPASLTFTVNKQFQSVNPRNGRFVALEEKELKTLLNKLAEAIEPQIKTTGMTTIGTSNLLRPAITIHAAATQIGRMRRIDVDFIRITLGGAPGGHGADLGY